ncbi:metal-dependent hydrolase [Thiolapillus sp.]
MLLPTHLVTGQTAYLLACVAANHPPAHIEALAAIGASALPDLDCRQGYVGRLIPPVSGWLEHHFGHRTLTHALIPQLIVGVAGYFFLPTGYYLALMAGWISHTVSDMMTPAGVAWFWPSRVRCVLPGNERYRMKPMRWGELIFAAIMGLSAAIFMQLAAEEAGTTGLIRAAIGNISAAREDYDAMKGRNAWVLEVKGRDNRSHADISGRYAVIGPYREGGFILDSGQGARSVCRQESCDWYADHAVLKRAEPQNTTTQHIEADYMSTSELRRRMKELEAFGRVYISGRLEARNIRNNPPTVEATDTGVTLRYAAPEELQEWKNRSLRNLAIDVQVRHAPGIVVPEFDSEQDSGAEMNPLLDKWVRPNVNSSHYRVGGVGKNNTR